MKVKHQKRENSVQWSRCFHRLLTSFALTFPIPESSQASLFVPAAADAAAAAAAAANPRTDSATATYAAAQAHVTGTPLAPQALKMYPHNGLATVLPNVSIAPELTVPTKITNGSR